MVLPRLSEEIQGLFGSSSRLSWELLDLPWQLLSLLVSFGDVFWVYLVAIFGLGSVQINEQQFVFDVFQRFAFSARGSLGDCLWDVMEFLL